ncbi:hypothetical protein GCM10022288_20860 [Gryllotalpicola kribbensis]|uniref:N-acetyltransferase domain-containing protein n=1 Tax=Gryllotalpicola kribbensis TaxID=993084 RepID=A0ABP8AUG6_9MICO
MAVVDCEVVGFVTVIADEVEELFVERAVRGRGIAAALLHHAEAAIRAEGFIEGWLAVIAENTRARRFYEREGWVDRGPFEYQAQGADGPLLVPSHRYARPLGT